MRRNGRPDGVDSCEHERRGRRQQQGRNPPVSRGAPKWLASAVWALLASACDEEGLPHVGTLQYESESFEVWASDGLQACGGTYEYMEDWLAAFRARVGAHGDPAKHTFYWVGPADFELELCTTGVACAYPTSNVIYSTIIPAEHEIVHAELDAQPPSVLVEGAAEVFGSVASPFTISTMSIDPLLDDEQIPGIGYQTAGRFSRFIIERHGLDAYFALYAALDGVYEREAFAKAVKDTLGVELSALVEDFESVSPCSVAHWRYYDHECTSVPLTPWESPTRWSEDIDLSCAADDVIGPRRGLVWTLRALEVEQEGTYELVVESADESAQVAIIPCKPSCYADEPTSVAVSGSLVARSKTSVSLTAGRHWMRVDHSSDSDAPVSVTLERQARI